MKNVSVKSILTGMLFFSNSILSIGITTEPAHVSDELGAEYQVSYIGYDQLFRAYDVELIDGYGKKRLGFILWDVYDSENNNSQDSTVVFNERGKEGTCLLNPYTPFPGALSKKKLFLGAARKRVLRREKSFFSDNPFATEQVDTGIERPPTPYENEFD